METLLPHCTTDHQRKIVLAVAQHGSRRKAAEALGLASSGVIATMATLSQRAEKKAEDDRGAKRIFVIPDVQAKPNTPLEHLEAAGRYVAEKRPDIIVCLGDFADMPSLSMFDKGKRAFEGRRYKADIAAAHLAMETLMTPIANAAGYNPKLILTIGNHEFRITRATESDAMLDGTLGLDDLGYAAWGWQVIPFLEVVEVKGINFSHYFYNPNSGRPWAGTAHTKLKNIGLSFVMGHQQGIDVATRELPNGRRQFGIVAGSFYQHHEDYKGPQGNGHWQGCLMLNEAQDGEFDLMQLSLNYLLRKFGKKAA